MAARESSARPPDSRHRSTLSLQKTEITIHVYDLLPPGRISSVLWTVGASLLHSGVVINEREYAYGGHDKHGVTGVYWTKPKTEPPGGRFRCEILHGFTLATHDDIDATLRAASEEFLGPSYNLLTKNCNHFTSYLCQKLTGNAGPGWLNRAASIGVALPCVVPRDWVEPPEYDTADGELLRRRRRALAHAGPVPAAPALGRRRRRGRRVGQRRGAPPRGPRQGQAGGAGRRRPPAPCGREGPQAVASPPDSLSCPLDSLSRPRDSPSGLGRDCDWAALPRHGGFEAFGKQGS